VIFFCLPAYLSELSFFILRAQRDARFNFVCVYMYLFTEDYEGRMTATLGWDYDSRYGRRDNTSKGQSTVFLLLRRPAIGWSEDRLYHGLSHEQRYTRLSWGLAVDWAFGVLRIR
jgi:hypothetical protein